jgi:hypothetical protein
LEGLREGWKKDRTFIELYPPMLLRVHEHSLTISTANISRYRRKHLLFLVKAPSFVE